jgi:hypothetical protein
MTMVVKYTLKSLSSLQDCGGYLIHSRQVMLYKKQQTKLNLYSAHGN